MARKASILRPPERGSRFAFSRGWDFTKDDLNRSDFAKHGYDNGVPMGGDLASAPEGKVPAFLIRALRDVDGANLDRIQIVKGWLAADGGTQEKVYDVAWSGDRKVGADGKLPPVGNTVNVKEATYSNAIGAPVPGGVLEGSGFRSSRACLLLCARTRNPNSALDDF